MLGVGLGRALELDTRGRIKERREAKEALSFRTELLPLWCALKRKTQP